MRRIILSNFGLVGILILMMVSAASASECVVLLHGLARSSMSLNSMEQALQEDGYLTANIDYPSREFEVAELASIAVEDGLAACRAGDGTAGAATTCVRPSMRTRDPACSTSTFATPDEPTNSISSQISSNLYIVSCHLR